MITEKDFGKGFKKAMYQVRMCDKQKIITEICKILEINNNISFNNYKLGKTECKASDALQIDKLFAKYGIKEVWGVGLPSIITGVKD